ncbi:MAG: hypothetical protein Q8P46_16090 [Hyphomicrobiales bacterium]|nr:hypothetical protein [Hyphomicrobiales bacterium]
MVIGDRFDGPNRFIRAGVGRDARYGISGERRNTATAQNHPGQMVSYNHEPLLWLIPGLASPAFFASLLTLVQAGYAGRHGHHPVRAARGVTGPRPHLGKFN